MKEATCPELYDINVRRGVLLNLRERLDEGFKDPAFLYLGGRYASSLGLKKETSLWVKKYSDLYKENQIGYFPFGILMLNVLEPGKDKEELFKQLQELIRNEPKQYKDLLYSSVSLEQGLNGGQNKASTGFELLNEEFEDMVTRLFNTIKLPEQLVEKEAEENWTLANIQKKNEKLNKFQQLQFLSQLATDTFENNKASVAGMALEQMLMIDEDQPDVIRNLLTIASEQKDIEAYERYWRRYVQLLLWRILCENNKESAYKDLFLFYANISGVLESICNHKDSPILDYLSKHGFLSRWLEANAALVWLSSKFNSNLNDKSNLSNTELEKGLKGNLEIMEYWMKAFYPAFSKYLRTPEFDWKSFQYLPSYSIKYSLTHDPAFAILLRFLEWGKFRFGIPDEPSPAQSDTLAAFAGIVCRIPYRPYLALLSDELEDKDILANNTIAEWISSNCSFPFYTKLNRCFADEVSWAEITGYFGDPAIRKHIKDNSVIYYVALAYFQEKDIYNSYLVISELISCISIEDKQGENKYTELIESLNHGLLSLFIEEDQKALELLGEKVGITYVPYLSKKGDFNSQIKNDNKKAELLSAITNEIEFSNNKLPMLAFVKGFNKTITEVIENVKHRNFITQIQENTRSHFENGDLEAAKEEILKLPDTTDQLKETRNEYLKQVEEARFQREKQKRIDDTIENIREYVKAFEFERARTEVRSLPDSPKDMKDLKERFFTQIDEAESHNQLNEIVEWVQKEINRSDYRAALRRINELPDHPQQTKEVKDKLYRQVKDLESQHNESKHMNDMVESALSKFKTCAENGDFAGAKEAINTLPDSPNQVRELKNNYLKQIEDAEKDIGDKISALTSELSSKGVDWERLGQIAVDNKIELKTPVQMYSFLNSVSKQL